MKTDMTKGNPMKIILLFSIPVLMGNLFQQFYNMVDTIIVGQYLGSKALAAVGSTGCIMFLVLGFANGIAQGFGVMASHAFGAKKGEAFEALCGFSYHSYCDCFSGAHDSDSACVEAASYLAQYT